jgi:hypothetical protein
MITSTTPAKEIRVARVTLATTTATTTAVGVAFVLKKHSLMRGPNFSSGTLERLHLQRLPFSAELPRAQMPTAEVPTTRRKTSQGKAMKARMSNTRALLLRRCTHTIAAAERNTLSLGALSCAQIGLRS